MYSPARKLWTRESHAEKSWSTPWEHSTVRWTFPFEIVLKHHLRLVRFVRARRRRIRNWFLPRLLNDHCIASRDSFVGKPTWAWWLSPNYSICSRRGTALSIDLFISCNHSWTVDNFELGLISVLWSTVWTRDVCYTDGTLSYLMQTIHLLTSLEYFSICPKDTSKTINVTLETRKIKQKISQSFLLDLFAVYPAIYLTLVLLIVSSATMTTISSTEKTRTRHNEVLLSLSCPASLSLLFSFSCSMLGKLIIFSRSLSLSTWNVYVRTLVSFFSFEALVFIRVCRGIIFIERTGESERERKRKKTVFSIALCV